MATDDAFHFRYAEHYSNVFPNFEKIRRLGKFCDVTLIADGQKFSAHKIILAASIPYFQGMFMHDMVEANKAEIPMKGMESKSLEAIINYAYSGEITITPENVQGLLIGSNFLQTHEVKDACCDFMKQRISINSVLSIRKFADRFLCTSLLEAANSFLCQHFEAVARLDEFLEISVDDVCEILAFDDLRVSTEKPVFEAAMAWIKFEPQSRERFTADLLKLVRLPMLPPTYLSDNVASEPAVRNSLICRDLLDEARDYHLLPERRPQLRSFRARPRCCHDVVGVIYAVGGLTSSGDSISTVERFDPILNKWLVAENMTTHRSRVGVAVLNGQLYAIGGFDGHDRLNTVEVFDPREAKWQRVAPMNCCRSALGAAAMDGRLYVCGGYDGVSSLRTCEVYYPKNDRWHMLPSMNDCRSAGGVVALGGLLYALGGHNGLAIYESVEAYNPHVGTWRMVAKMQTRRCRHGVAVSNGKIYAAGGYNGVTFLRTVEAYDTQANQWSYVTPLSVARSRVALTATCGRIYAIGGYDGVMNLRSVECYEEVTDSWSFTAPLTAHEGGVGVGVLPFQDEEADNSRQEQSDGSAATSSPSDASSTPVSPGDASQAFFRRRPPALEGPDEATEDEREELNDTESRRRRRVQQDRGNAAPDRLSS